MKEEGVFTLNKELPFPTLPKRVAVITSPTAAGYEDFLNQLANNKEGYPFYTKLFPALMQGERTEESVIAALDGVYRHADCFDVVVIIRGGGATSDLNSFDSYLLAANCAQFPLPIITGIGHERDDTILDMVAHTRMKTPTAVAEFLIGQMDRAAGEVEKLQQDVCSLATDILLKQKNLMQLLGSRLPVFGNKPDRTEPFAAPTDRHAIANGCPCLFKPMGIEVGSDAGAFGKPCGELFGRAEPFCPVDRTVHQDGFSRLCIEAGLQLDAEGWQDHQASRRIGCRR